MNGVVFSPDGTRIISGSSDRTVRVWDVDVGRPITGAADPKATAESIVAEIAQAAKRA